MRRSGPAFAGAATYFYVINKVLFGHGLLLLELRFGYGADQSSENLVDCSNSVDAGRHALLIIVIVHLGCFVLIHLKAISDDRLIEVIIPSRRLSTQSSTLYNFVLWHFQCQQGVNTVPRLR